MRYVNSFVALTAAVITNVRSAPLEERAINCADYVTILSGDYDRASRFCNVYLQLIPVTLTQTESATRVTKTSTIPEYRTTTATVTPAALRSSIFLTSTTSTTITPSTKTVTQQETSTAYLDPYGSTISILKRDVAPSPRELAPRAIVTPSYFKGLRKTEIKAACACMQLSTPTYTRTRTVGVTATVDKAIQRTIRSTTTLAAATSSTTILTTRGVTVTAAAPQSTVTTWAVEQVKGCPPATTPTWLCPEQTADDDGSHDNYLSCKVMAQDQYSGYCLYWDDDGSPAGSTLIKGNGSGNPDLDQSREAIYGDADTDDCPSWSDWTCAASGGQKRSTLEKLSEDFTFAKRGFIPKRVSLAEHRRAGKKKMPLGLRRGGKYRHTKIGGGKKVSSS